MRHLWSLIAGVIVAPLAWALLGMGQAGSAETVAAWGTAGAYDTHDLIKPAAYLVAAGILLGLIATLRISPVGPMVAGAIYLALGVGLFIDPFAVRDAVPRTWSVAGEPIALRTPLLNGTLVAIGVLLFIPVVSLKRWRSWPPPAPAAPVAEPPDTPATSGETEVVVPENTHPSEARPSEARPAEVTSVPQPATVRPDAVRPEPPSTRQPAQPEPPSTGQSRRPETIADLPPVPSPRRPRHIAPEPAEPSGVSDTPRTSGSPGVLGLPDSAGETGQDGAASPWAAPPRTPRRDG